VQLSQTQHRDTLHSKIALSCLQAEPQQHQGRSGPRKNLKKKKNDESKSTDFFVYCAIRCDSFSCARIEYSEISNGDVVKFRIPCSIATVHVANASFPKFSLCIPIEQNLSHLIGFLLRQLWALDQNVASPGNNAAQTTNRHHDL
jgi:hypothetical protein